MKGDECCNNAIAAMSSKCYCSNTELFLPKMKERSFHMKTKKVPEVSKNSIKGGSTMAIIEKVLEFIESEEIRNHLRNWFENGKGCDKYTCAEIIFNAPVPIEQKLQGLNLFIKKCKEEDGYLSKVEGITLEYVEEIALEIEIALRERYRDENDNENPEGTEFKLFMYDKPNEPCKFNSFDEAAEHIRQVRKQDNDVSNNKTSGNPEHPRINIVEKWVPYEICDPELDIYWLLNDSGEILYYVFSADSSSRTVEIIPGRLKFSVPFKPGDIIVADCSPFAKEKRVVILENNDTLDEVDANNVTCLFINNYDNIDTGYLKFNEFLQYPRQTHTSVLYRAKTFTGELPENEKVLGIVSDAVKTNPDLGFRIFRYFESFKNSVAIHFNPEENSLSYGVKWKQFKETFRLK